jgi:hypothetical protein
VEGNHQPSDEPAIGVVGLVAFCHGGEGSRQESNCRQIREGTPIQCIHLRESLALTSIDQFVGVAITLLYYYLNLKVNSGGYLPGILR